MLALVGHYADARTQHRGCGNSDGEGNSHAHSKTDETQWVADSSSESLHKSRQRAHRAGCVGSTLAAKML